LELESPIIVGHSLGGSVGLLYGVLFQPRSIIGIDPIHLHLPYLSTSLAPYRARLEGDEFEAAFAEWEGRLGLDLVPEPQRSVLTSGMHPRRDVVLAYWETVLDATRATGIQPQLADGLASITAPTLLLFADPPRPEDAAILERMASTTVEVWNGLGHFLHFVDPQRFVDRVRTWIADLA
jgi:pimeloyl-ACP methyl ester carboxylesterase